MMSTLTRDHSSSATFTDRVCSGLYYNFWQDEVHVRGIWRRTTLAEYRKDSPSWETVLDLDVLSKVCAVCMRVA